MSEKTDEAEDGGFGPLSPDDLAGLAVKAKIAGKQAVLPILQEAIREEVVRILNENEPDELRGYIDVGYPLVQEELPEGYKNALATAGPNFESQIIQVVTPEQVVQWFTHPEEWMDDDTDEEELARVREVGRILQTHPGADQWLESQVLGFYEVCNII